MKKYKWYYWDIFNQKWMDNGEGVDNWRKQGFIVKRMAITTLLLFSALIGFGQKKTDSVQFYKDATNHYYHYYLKYKALRDSIDNADTAYVERVIPIQTFYIDTKTRKMYIYRNHKLIFIK